MKPKTKQMLDLILTDPKISHTEAYLRTHKTTNRNSAKVSAAQTLTKPNAQLYLKRHRQLAKETKVRILTQASKKPNELNWQNLANTVAEQVLDRTEGRPIQRQVTDNRHRILISLGSVTEETNPHPTP